MQGWITCFAWISTLAGVANTTAYMLQSLGAANYPSYEAKEWHVTLLIFALLIAGGLINMYTWFLITWLETLAGVLHVVLFIIFVVVLVSLTTPQRRIRLHKISEFFWMDKSIRLLQHGVADTNMGFCR